jgi:2-polyprenyl-6-methoxyphenol hydroxylase-like FAD-dependent oxidoreductase
MPQPVLLRALHEKAKSFPTFELWFDASAVDLNFEGTKCVGVAVNKAGEDILVKAQITVGTDGRFSMVRGRGHFQLEYEDHRFDLVWFTIQKPASYDNHVRFFLAEEQNFLILPKYPDSIQCGLVVPKGGFLLLHKAGLGAMKTRLGKLHPMFREFADALRDFKEFNVLQAKIEFVKRWAKDGAVLIGDSAHTCSPAGAIGVSVAVESAIVGADVIFKCLRARDVSQRSLDKIQSIREKKVRRVHALQMRFSELLFPRARVIRRLLPWMIPLLGQWGVIQKFQREILVLKEPLPVGSEIHA